MPYGGPPPIRYYGRPDTDRMEETSRTLIYTEEKVVATYTLTGNPRRWHVQFTGLTTGKVLNRNEVARRMRHRQRQEEVAQSEEPKTTPTPTVNAQPKTSTPKTAPVEDYRSKTANTKPKTSVSTPSSPKTVHVKGYRRKDGTYVEGYDRAAPGKAKKNHKRAPQDGEPKK